MTGCFHNSLHLFVYIHYFIASLRNVYVKPRCPIIRRISKASVGRVDIRKRIIRFKTYQGHFILFIRFQLERWTKSGSNLRVLFAHQYIVRRSDISINGNRNRNGNGNDFFTEMESKNGNELEMELE